MRIIITLLDINHFIFFYIIQHQRLQYYLFYVKTKFTYKRTQSANIRDELFHCIIPRTKEECSAYWADIQAHLAPAADMVPLIALKDLTRGYFITYRTLQQVIQIWQGLSLKIVNTLFNWPYNLMDSSSAFCVWILSTYL